MTINPTSEAPGQAHCKGVAVLARLKFVQERYGDEGMERLRAALTPQTIDIIDHHILPHEWVSMDVFIALNEAADRLFGSGDLALVREMGAWAADYTLSTIFKLFIRMGSPMFLFQNVAKVWRAHYDTGQLVAHREGVGPVHLELRDVVNPHRTHCQSVMGWAMKSIELSGGTVTSFDEPKCRSRGDEMCELVIAWEE